MLVCLAALGERETQVSQQMCTVLAGEGLGMAGFMKRQNSWRVPPAFGSQQHRSQMVAPLSGAP